MARKINQNRYRLVTLLYVIFVCLSVLNIPASFLDSNIYLIRTLEYQEKERLLQVDFANKVIETHKEQLSGDTTAVYIRIQNRLHKSYQWVDSMDHIIQATFAKEGTNVYAQFSNKRKIEEIFLKDSLIYRLKKEMFLLQDFMAVQPFRIDNAIRDLLPIQEDLKTQSGKKVSWEQYLFLHKPTAISYVQVKRIKLLLLDNEYVYQAAALKTIDYLPAFFSRKENRVFIDKKEDQVLLLNQPPKVKEIQPAAPVAPEVKTPAPAENKNEFDNLYQKIISSLHVENLYVGIANTMLKDIDVAAQKDFSVSVDPSADINQSGSNYNITFRKSGDYTIRFTDKRGGTDKLLFEKKIHASLLPNPSVRLNIENATKDVLSAKDLLTLNRLVSSMDLGTAQPFPGRINGFRFTRIAKNGEKQAVENYGEVFRGPSQELMGQLQRGDIIFFDNITIYLADGTTRTPNPILYKIVD
jgi:hypothetical protein